MQKKDKRHAHALSKQRVLPQPVKPTDSVGFMYGLKPVPFKLKPVPFQSVEFFRSL